MFEKANRLQDPKNRITLPGSLAKAKKGFPPGSPIFRMLRNLQQEKSDG